MLRSHPERYSTWLLYLLSWASCWSASRNKCLANLRIRSIKQIYDNYESNSEDLLQKLGALCPGCPALTKYYGCVKASGSDFGVARAFPAPFSFERHSSTNCTFLLPLPQAAFVPSSEGSCNLANPLAKCLSYKASHSAATQKHCLGCLGMFGDVWCLQCWQSIIHKDTQGTFFRNQRSCEKLSDQSSGTVDLRVDLLG